MKAAIPAPAQLRAPAHQGDWHQVAAGPAYRKGLGNYLSQAVWESWRESDLYKAKLKHFNIPQLMKWNDKRQEQLSEH